MECTTLSHVQPALPIQKGDEGMRKRIYSEAIWVSEHSSSSLQYSFGLLES